MTYRSLSLSEKELEMVLLIRQLVQQAGQRDTDILVQKRGAYLRVCGVGMPERLVQPSPNLTPQAVIK
jgi:hypothetical protein